MYLELFQRFKSELMVLGFLAFIVWCFNVGSVFDAIAEAIATERPWHCYFWVDVRGSTTTAKF